MLLTWNESVALERSLLSSHAGWVPINTMLLRIARLSRLLRLMRLVRQIQVWRWISECTCQ
eukprot:4560503-Amphidinium_carterae.1